MEYTYFYQTSSNENRKGAVKAASRAEAYALLRKSGIRPYRLVGDDPPKWRGAVLHAMPVLIVAAVAAAAAVWFVPQEDTPLPRRQISGEASLITASLASGWTDVFPSLLDRHLAAYAQPGWIALPPIVDGDARSVFKDGLSEPLPRLKADDPRHVKEIKRIVAGMRRDMEKYLSDGGTVDGYLAFLDERQDEERALRTKAAESVDRAPEDMRERVRLNINARLRGMGIAEIPSSAGEGAR